MFNKAFNIKIFIFILITLVLIIPLSACESSGSQETDYIEPKASTVDKTAAENSTIQSSTTNKAATSTKPEADKNLPEVAVIYQYADFINQGEYDKANECLGRYLRLDNHEYMKNISHMDVKKVVEKTGRSGWNFNPREIGDVVDLHVYYVEVEYKLVDRSKTYLMDGMNYHKIITVRETEDSPWKIAEMSYEGLDVYGS